MEIRALIHIESPVVACRPILGLPAIIRTVKTLFQEGCSKIILVGADETLLPSLLRKYGLRKKVHLMPMMPKSTEGFLLLSGQMHYDPDFIQWMVRGRVHLPDPFLKQVPHYWWGPLEGPEKAVSWVERKLFLSIHKKTEGWVARYINKPISFRLSRFLVRTSLTPNQITFFCLVLAVMAAFLLTDLSYFWRVIGVCLMYVSSILDGCDGEVARLKIQTSKKGAWFDTIVDDIANNLFLMGLFIGLYWSTGNSLYLNVGVVALVFSLAVTGMIYYQLISLRNSANAKDFKPVWQKEDAKGSRWFEWVRPLMKRDFFIAVVFIFVLLDQRVFLFWIAVLATFVTFAIHLVSFVLLASKKIVKAP